MRLFLLSSRGIALALRGGALICLATLCSSCSIFDSTCSEDDRTCLTNPLLAEGAGGKCERNADCKTGLDCIKGTCTATGDTPRGSACRLTAECGEKDYCGSKRVCQIAGIASTNSRCTTTGACEHGLVCLPPDLSQQGTVSLSDLASVSGLCEDAGKKEQGGKCADSTDCLAGLTCIDEQLICDVTMSCDDVVPGSKLCVSLPESDTELPALPALWKGVVCPTVKKTDPAEAYFEVPRAGELDEAAFYSLPFPTDIRREGGHVNLAGHPLPPDDLGVPLVHRYVEAAGSDLDGFSTNPVVFFRFSKPYDFGTVTADTLKLVDITDKAQPEYDKLLGIEWKTTSGDLSNYICPHFLALKPPPGAPLKAGRTYAAIVTTGVKPDKNTGGTFKRSDDLSALLDDSAPSDADLKAAYSAFAPLRAWIADTKQEPDQILTATVFTTHSPEATIPALREQVHGDALPTLSDLTVCASDKTASPCESEETEKDDDGKEVMVTRGACPAANGDYTVIHGRIKLPVFQKGTEPYLAPEDGGNIELDGSGDPVVQDHQDVCFALSVPKATAPAAGYPVLVYGHGTGGSFTGEMDSGGFAGPLATGTVPAALMAIDLPEHGARRGDSKDSPESLFYNFLNPRAARDNVLQGSADLMAVIRWVKESGGLKAGAPLASAVAFDTSRIALMGHSQGSTHSALIASYEPDVIGVVLSGNGGNLAASLLHKTSPVDIASVIPLGLMDPDSNFHLAAGEFNPALAMIQWVFDASDPVNYAPHVIHTPTMLVPNGHHVFMTYGIGDTYAPEETQQAYVRAVGRQMQAVLPMPVDLRLAGETTPWPSASAPVSGNVTIGSEQRTVAVREYTPSSADIDGHFVGTRAGEDGRADVERFLDQLLAGQTPAVGK